MNVSKPQEAPVVDLTHNKSIATVKKWDPVMFYLGLSFLLGGMVTLIGCIVGWW